MRTCTSDAPASNSICTIARVVLPRTIESSTTTTRLPATSASGLNFKRTPSRRSSWSGWMNVRPMYRFLISPSLNGIPSARENPIAAGVPESGIGRTRSASAGASCADDHGVRRPGFDGNNDSKIRTSTSPATGATETATAAR